MVGGVLESGCYRESTVIGDAVTVAQRLRTLAELLDSPLVISSELLARLQGPVPAATWVSLKSAALPRRLLSIDVWYLCREPGAANIRERNDDTGVLQTALQRSSFQSVPPSFEVGIG